MTAHNRKYWLRARKKGHVWVAEITHHGVVVAAAGSTHSQKHAVAKAKKSLLLLEE